MSGLKRVLPILAAVTMSAGAASAGSNGIKLDQVWARPVPGATDTGAIYLTITNTSSAPDMLQGASTPVAARISLRQMTVENGVKEMRAVRGLTIAPGKSVVLQPGGYQLMLEGLTEPLKEGQVVPLTLSFTQAGTAQVMAWVAKSGTTRTGATSDAGQVHGGMASALSPSKTIANIR